MSRLTCKGKKENAKNCGRFLGDLLEGAIEIRCPKCGNTTVVNMTKAVGLQDLMYLIHGGDNPHIGSN
jgi:predicted RNA-binding Zn-ribbon protein involved in translation (DUF1610 family)